MKLSDVSLDVKSLALGAMVGGAIMLSVAAGTTPSSDKWEYKVATPPREAFGDAKGGYEAWQEKVQAFLNDLGKDGWGLVSKTDGRVFYFKRSIK